jgi:acetyl-CoA carboxylase carboxyl transferase subunit alpha
MLENSIYSVISPEAGASILFRDAAKAQDMATAQKITAQDLLGFGVIDGIIPEPAGGAHRHHEHIMDGARSAISSFLAEFANKGRLEVREHRREKFLAIGTTL